MSAGVLLVALTNDLAIPVVLIHGQATRNVVKDCRNGNF